MRLLVLGGTAFLGRAVCQAALSRGHEVTCVARGLAGSPAQGARLVRADRDDPAARLGGAEGEPWDAVVDVARQPGQVRRATEALAGSGAHYVFVSTGNVYADHATVGADEAAPLLTPLESDVMADMSEYGPAKVACEAHVRAAFADDGWLIARAGLIGGPGDRSGRTGYWPWRLAHPSNPAGQVLIPDIPDFPCQVIDVRDLADWLVRCAEDRAAGAVNASGDTISFTELLDTAAEAAGARPTLVSADPAWLIGQGVEEWMGPRSMPMWIADPEYAGFTSRSNAAAREMGLRPRPLVQTLRDVLAWEQSRSAEEPRQAGLTDAEERELLDALAGGRPASAD